MEKIWKKKIGVTRAFPELLVISASTAEDIKLSQRAREFIDQQGIKLKTIAHQNLAAVYNRSNTSRAVIVVVKH